MLTGSGPIWAQRNRYCEKLRGPRSGTLTATIALRTPRSTRISATCGYGVEPLDSSASSRKFSLQHARRPSLASGYRLRRHAMHRMPMTLPGDAKGRVGGVMGGHVGAILCVRAGLVCNAQACASIVIRGRRCCVARCPRGRRRAQLLPTYEPASPVPFIREEPAPSWLPRDCPTTARYQTCVLVWGGAPPSKREPSESAKTCKETSARSSARLPTRDRAMGQGVGLSDRSKSAPMTASLQDKAPEAYCFLELWGQVSERPTRASSMFRSTMRPTSD